MSSNGRVFFQDSSVFSGNFPVISPLRPRRASRGSPPPTPYGVSRASGDGGRPSRMGIEPSVEPSRTGVSMGQAFWASRTQRGEAERRETHRGIHREIQEKPRRHQKSQGDPWKVLPPQSNSSTPGGHSMRSPSFQIDIFRIFNGHARTKSKITHLTIGIINLI